MYIQGATAHFVQPTHIHQQNLLQHGLCVEEELWVLDCQIFCQGICICSIMYKYTNLSVFLKRQPSCQGQQDINTNM